MHWIYFCFVISGATALIYEVIWLRWLTDYLGSTTLATSLILTVYMGGMALGSYLSVYMLRKWRSAWRIYASLEFLIAAYALCSLFLFHWISHLNQLLFKLPLFIYWLVFFIMVNLFLMLPTICMGATLPIIVSALKEHRKTSYQTSGLLYAYNTMGAVFGSLLAGFILIRFLGLQKSLYITACVNLLLAIFVYSVSFKNPNPNNLDSIQPRLFRGLKPILPQLLLVTFAGWTAMSLEVIYTRYLSQIFGTSTYAFSILLASYLTGLCTGSFVQSWMISKKKACIKDLSVFLILAACFSCITLVALNWVPFGFSSLFLNLQSCCQQWMPSNMNLMLVKILISLAIMLPGAYCFGAIFPICVALLEQAGIEAETSTARVYLFNTIGSVIGSIVTGLILAPLIGLYLTGLLFWLYYLELEFIF